MKAIAVRSFYFLAACLMLAGCEKKLGEGVTLKDIEVGTPLKIMVGESVKAKAFPVPWDCTDYEFTWEIADPSIASTDHYGRIMGEDVGNTVIYVSQGGQFKKEIPLEVYIDYSKTFAGRLEALGAKAMWEFQDAANLYKATFGPDLIPVGSGFTQTDGPANRKKAISIPCSQRVDDVWQYNHFLYNHGFAANGGGQKVNEFTIVIDCKFPGGPTGGAAWTNGKYYCLYQTALDNTSDGDFFWRPPANFGITGSYTKDEHLFVKDTWYRFIISAQLGKDLKYFMNGDRYEAGSVSEVDNDRAWNLEGVLLFADEDGEDGQGFPLIVSSLAVFDRALTEDEIKTIGKME
jgi:hypothetical protein